MTDTNEYLEECIDQLKAEIARLRALGLEATDQIAKLIIEVNELRAALAIARNWMPLLSEALTDTVKDEVRTVEAALANADEQSVASCPHWPKCGCGTPSGPYTCELWRAERRATK
jgi:hypothetical protein